MTLRYYVKPDGQYAGAASVADGQNPQTAFNPLRDAGYLEVPEAGMSAEWFWDFSAHTWYRPASAVTERNWRDDELARWVWLRDRHRDQQELGVATTLTTEQFALLLRYLQQLREWPQASEFPEAAARPLAPAFLERQRSAP